MKTTKGWPIMQKNIQKDTLLSSLFYILKILSIFLWMNMVGACIIIAKNAQYEINPRGTETKYSWAIADTKNTIKLAAVRLDPS